MTVIGKQIVNRFFNEVCFDSIGCVTTVKAFEFAHGSTEPERQLIRMGITVTV